MTLRGAQKDLADARAEVERAKNDPNSRAFKAAQQKLAMAQYAHDLAAKNLDLHQQEFGNKLQEQDLLKPSGQAQSRGSEPHSIACWSERSVNSTSISPSRRRQRAGQSKAWGWSSLEHVRVCQRLKTCCERSRIICQLTRKSFRCVWRSQTTPLRCRRMPSPAASRRNLEQAKARWRKPRPWRCEVETQ